MLSYRSAVLAKHPVGYWRLGDRRGKIASDSSGHGLPGAYLGHVNLGERGALRSDPDTAVAFTAADRSYVEIADPATRAFSQPTSRAGLTVEVWMRPDALHFHAMTSERYIHWLGKCAPNRQCEWGFRFYSDDSPSRAHRISAYIWTPEGGEGAGAFFEHRLTIGEWLHIVAVYDPGDKDTVPLAGVHIYRNGVLEQGPPAHGTLYRSFDIVPAHGAAPLRLGTRDAAASGESAVSYLTGALDEVAVYPRVLTRDEILEHYRLAIRPR